MHYGTSFTLVFAEFILAVYGSPDVRQIDGLGGADVLTSKHAIISPSTRPNEPMSWATPPKPSAI